MRQVMKSGRGASKKFFLEGLTEVQANLAAVMDAMTGKHVKDVYYEAGKTLRDQARSNAPHGAQRTKGVHLRDAIFVDMGEAGKSDVLVGVRYKMPGGAPHAHLVEYGTSKMQARPYFRPAIAQSIDRMRNIILSGLQEVIQGAIARGKYLAGRGQ